jgi:uncharacterized membrane protein YeaQ/YmgE (transglycosylase-associated protein family)
MTRAGFAWRAAVFAFLVLQLIAVAVGSVAVQFDDQYSYVSILQRVFVGVMGGVVGACLFSPLSALISAGVGCVAGLYYGHRVPPSSSSP